ncbi:hypothetical protein PF008_g10992 [Phytophthora fragariae]|uniref:Uncharacterized protein n=1 Tax=Phytophthora fragariae TaxID=53985 RepID=A0A6G0RS37_9STRA|nr:hypothetical protein PF008_g10992 [Phytophthora fragariae]
MVWSKRAGVWLGRASPKGVGAARTMICVSVAMPGGRSGARVCSEERELPNEAVLEFPLGSPTGTGAFR